MIHFEKVKQPGEHIAAPIELPAIVVYACRGGHTITVRALNPPCVASRHAPLVCDCPVCGQSASLINAYLAFGERYSHEEMLAALNTVDPTVFTV